MDTNFSQTLANTTLQVVSDVHLEFYTLKNMPTIKKHGDHLALLGDIGKPFLDTYRTFLSIQSRQFDKVFVLLGNHEYYNSAKSVDQISDKARQVCSEFPNVHLLERDVFNLTERTRILGCTLWSMIDSRATAALNDFQKIRVRNVNGIKEKLSKTTYVGWHIRDVAWLREQIRECEVDHKDAIILTHHGVLPEMSGVYVGSPISSGFVSNLSHMFRPPVKAFASGHVHSNVDITYNNIRSVSNAMGYPGEGVNYTESTIIDVF